jgi:hypothetical protein
MPKLIIIEKGSIWAGKVRNHEMERVKVRSAGNYVLFEYVQGHVHGTEMRPKSEFLARFNPSFDLIEGNSGVPG